MSLSVRPAKPLPPDAIPPRVAVASFENRSGFAGQWELGEGMADLLVAELVLSRNFEVLERGRLDRVVDEISRQRNKLFREEGKVEAGRLKNAQYLIRGVITDFSQVSGGSLWIGIRKLLLGGGGYKARVALTLTIVDVETGEIVDSLQCAASAKARNAYAKAEYKNVRFGGEQFFKTPLGIATTHAIRQGIKGLITKIPQIRWQPMIAEVTNTRIIINGGHDREVEVGQYYQVREAGRPVTDPATGDVLEILPGKVIGAIQVREVFDGVSSAEVFRGAGFARGQYLQPVLPPEEPTVQEQLPQINR